MLIHQEFQLPKNVMVSRFLFDLMMLVPDLIVVLSSNGDQPTGAADFLGISGENLHFNLLPSGDVKIAIENCDL